MSLPSLMFFIGPLLFVFSCCTKTLPVKFAVELYKLKQRNQRVALLPAFSSPIYLVVAAF